MKKITVFLLMAVFILSPALVFADDAQNAPDQNAPALPKPPDTPTPPVLPTPPLIPIMREVVATTDGGIVIVEGNKATKWNKDMDVVKSIDLTKTDNTGD